MPLIKDLCRTRSYARGRVGVKTPPLRLIFCKYIIIRGVYTAWFFTKIRGVCVEKYTCCVNKLRLKTWIRRQIVTSQTAHTKYKWPPSATEWRPPWKFSAYATGVEQVFPNFFILGPHTLLRNSERVGHLTLCDCFGICYIVPNQKVFRQLIFHYLQNAFADRI